MSRCGGVTEVTSASPKKLVLAKTSKFPGWCNSVRREEAHPCNCALSYSHLHSPAMSSARQVARPLFNPTRCFRQEGQSYTLPIRAFSSSAAQNEAAIEQTTSAQPPPSGLDPNNVYTAKAERKLLRTQNKTPIGSRRRRAALQSSDNIPFEQLPYQCFQEARKILGEDRQEKIKQIETQRARIARLKAQQVSPQDERQKEHRLSSMQRYLEELKILADINDPIVKKKFEDGQGLFYLSLSLLQRSHHSY